MPLHHQSQMGMKNGSVSRNGTRRKRIRRQRNKPLICFGRKIDIPVVGVASILIAGLFFMVMGGTAHFRPNAKQLQHHFDHHHADNYPTNSHQFDKNHHHRQLDDINEDMKRSAPQKSNHHIIETAGEPEVEEDIIPASAIRVVYDHKNKDDIYDVVVTGAGPSGLSAALFASRAGLKVHVLGSSSTGLLSQTKHLDNFPSFVGEKETTLSGPDWLGYTQAQAKSWGATFGPPGMFAKSIERQRLSDDKEDREVFFTLGTDNEDIRAWSVIVATGATPRTLGLHGEEKLWGVSLHNCAICDGHLYQGTDAAPTTVLVVGGGDAALDAALLLARYATKVILVHRREEFTSAHNLASRKQVRSTPNIEIVAPYVVHKWITKEDDRSQLVGAELVSPKDASADAPSQNKRRVNIDGAFVMIGQTPNTKWTNNVGVALNEEGLIRTTANLPRSATPSMITASSVPGLFAAGEVTDNIYKQAITAASAGAQAAIDAERWLREERGVVETGVIVPGQAPLEGVISTGEEKMEPESAKVDSQQGDHNFLGLDNCELHDEDCISAILSAYPVVVFSKKWCPYCKKALEALARAGISEDTHDTILVIDLSDHHDSASVQETLQKMTGRRTVPNVFIGGKSIGGGDETAAFQQDGKLVAMLKKAGAFDGSESESEDTKAEEQRNMQEENKSNKVPSRHSSIALEFCKLSSKDCMESIIERYPVLLFSLSWCPECKRMFELLEVMGIAKDKIHVIDLDDYKEIEPDIRKNMKELSGWRSVPNLFVGGNWVGGFHHADKMKASGELLKKFQAVGVLS